MISLDILGRAPIPGYAKTRLIPLLGAEGAALAQERLLARIVQVAQQWCVGPGRQWRLWCAPDSSHPFFQGLADSARLRDQPEGGLGDRLEAIHHQALTEADGVLLLGADAASIGVEALMAAEMGLQRHPAVLAPAEDGGYVLLGLRQPAPWLFREMAWGSDQVAAETIRRLRRMGWAWGELTMQWDVDTPDDWRRFSSSIEPCFSPGGMTDPMP